MNSPESIISRILKIAVSLVISAYLIKMSVCIIASVYTKLVPGDRGTVEFVDAIGTIQVRWDCGSGLGVAYGEDVIRKI